MRFSSFARAVEWPTVVAIFLCYGAWGCGLWLAAGHGWLLAWPMLVVATAFHSSLQHEALHGHPTRHAGVNEWLVALPIGLWIPYRRFRTLHLRHHNDTTLTDPYDDPESFYMAARDWRALSALERALLGVNTTLLGRLMIGPALSLWGFWRSDWPLLRQSPAIRGAWARHALGVVVVIAALVALDLSPWHYAALVAYPAMSLLMIRTFAEHDAREAAQHRSAIIEHGGLLGLLFLNNHLHYVHHDAPRMPWYRLPVAFRANRATYLAANGGHVYAGYGEIFRRYFWRPRSGVVHPFMRVDNDQNRHKERASH